MQLLSFKQEKKRNSNQFKNSKTDQNTKHKNRRLRKYKQVSNIEKDEKSGEELTFDELKVMYDNELNSLEITDDSNQNNEVINTDRESNQMNNNDDDNSINIMEANSDGYTTWTFDTGVSEHITCNKDILTNFKKRKGYFKMC